MSESYPSQTVAVSPGPVTASKLVEQLIAFEGTPEEFLGNLLSLQSRLVSAAGSVVLLVGQGGRIEPVAIYPAMDDDASAPEWVKQAAGGVEQVVREQKTLLQPVRRGDELYGQPSRDMMILVPLRLEDGPGGAMAFVVHAQDQADLEQRAERLELTSSLLSLYSLRLRLRRRQNDFERLEQAMHTLAAVNDRAQFHAAAMSFCGELASIFQAERVSMGFLHGRDVKLEAFNHAEKFSRKMELVQSIEGAMEECLDQDIEVLYPEPRGATFVSRSAKVLSTKHGPAQVLSLPLRRDGQAIGALTVERDENHPFTLEEAEILRLACDLCTPRLIELHDRDRWFGARWAAALRKGLGVVVGPKHTWIKVAALAVLALAAVMTFVKASYEVEANFVLTATENRILPVPFESFLDEVHVELGETVKKGQLLVKLDTSELELQLASGQAERERYVRQESVARSEGKFAEAQIARTRIEAADAQIRLIKHRLAKAEIRSPIDGTVIEGDLKRQIGAPLKAGDQIFVIAPLSALHADLFVPEELIADVQEDQTGELATASYPSQRTGFVVRKIEPMARVKEEANVFRVRASLDETPRWMKPGMEGVAHIEIGRRRVGWIWTHKLIDWVRMKLWI